MHGYAASEREFCHSPREPHSPRELPRSPRDLPRTPRTGERRSKMDDRFSTNSKNLPLMDSPPICEHSTYRGLHQSAHTLKREVSMRLRSKLEGEGCHWGDHNNRLFPYPEAQTPSEIPLEDPTRQRRQRPVYAKPLVADGWNPSRARGRDSPFWSATCPVGGGFRDLKSLQSPR
jgi:hypothetical protein